MNKPLSKSKRLLFWLLRFFNGREPSPLEAYWAAVYCRHTVRIEWALLYYGAGAGLEQTAKNLNCTRERVRQMVRKGVRKAHVASKAA